MRDTTPVFAPPLEYDMSLDFLKRGQKYVVVQYCTFELFISLKSSNNQSLRGLLPVGDLGSSSVVTRDLCEDRNHFHCQPGKWKRGREHAHARMQLCFASEGWGYAHRHSPDSDGQQTCGAYTPQLLQFVGVRLIHFDRHKK